MPKPKLSICTIKLDPQAIAVALQLTTDEVMELFKDGRLTGRLAEVWGTRLYGYARHQSSNHPGSDGSIGQYEIAVRSFKDKLRFQESRFMGAGRSCTKNDLISSLEQVKMFVVVDLRSFPLVTFYPLDTKWLLRLVHQGQLSPSGISAQRFDQLLTSSFQLLDQPQLFQV